jgi:uncharacterized membrane protein
MTTDKPQISRRRFLKVAGAAGAVTIPAMLGYGLLHEARGEEPPSGSPYAPVQILESWPSQPAEASPILLLVPEDGDNPFGLYLAEILRAEGLNCFQVASLSDLGSAPLAWFDLILLAEGPLNDHQAELLEGYVANGGGLVAMRPDARLATLFGVERQAGTTAEGYLKVEENHPIGQGIATDTLQFHGTADHYGLAGAQVVAWLASDADTRTDFPAVSVHRHQGGQVALWAFDLARSVAYTRQGNPAWANQERDGLAGVRATDMFKDWIDLDRLSIPQADEQQRLLANLLSALSQGARPLPRLWYFPGAAESLLIVTGDSHGNAPSAIEEALTRVEQRGGHMSIYYTAYPSSDLRRAAKKGLLPLSRLPIAGDAIARQYSMPTPPQVADWRLRGHEFALHPYVEEGLEIGWRRHWEEFTGVGYGPVPPTTRTHRVLWQGWVETARTQAGYGIHLNLDSYHLGPIFRNEEGEWAYGYFTGSSLPMRFADEQGRILNIYQQPTLLADEHLLSLPWVTGEVPGLPSEEAIRVSQALLQRSVDGAYGAITAQFHVDPFALGGQAGAEEARWLEGTLDYAAAQGIPIWSALEWLRFTEVRHDASLGGIQWHRGQQRLTFDLVAQDDADVALTVMTPLHHGEAELVQIELDGVAIGHSLRRVGGVDFGWVSVQAGLHQVVVTYA